MKDSIPPSVEALVEDKAREIYDLRDNSDLEVVTLRFDGFSDDPILLHHCIWYILCLGKKTEIE